MKKLLLFLPFILFASDNNQTVEAQSLYLTNACPSCHGIYGQGIGTAPNITRQKPEEIVKRLNELKKGKTKTVEGSVMVSFAMSLDENQTLKMAEYLSTLKPNDDDERYDPEFDEGSS